MILLPCTGGECGRKGAPPLRTTAAANYFEYTTHRKTVKGDN